MMMDDGVVYENYASHEWLKCEGDYNTWFLIANVLSMGNRQDAVILLN